MHIQRLANAWNTYLNTPPQKLADQQYGATAIPNKTMNKTLNNTRGQARGHQPASSDHEPSPVDLEAATEVIPACQGSLPQRTNPEPKLPPTSSTHSKQSTKAREDLIRQWLCENVSNIF
jgi:hypothetical protein